MASLGALGLADRFWHSWHSWTCAGIAVPHGARLQDRGTHESRRYGCQYRHCVENTHRHCCLRGRRAAVIRALSTVFAWLPSYLNRYYGLPVDQAGVKAAIIVLLASLGVFTWGYLADHLSRTNTTNRMRVPAICVLASVAILTAAFALLPPGDLQFLAISLGGLFMTATVGPVAAVLIDVVHPGLRATVSAIVALLQNLLGLAAGPFITGVLSDIYGLQFALSVIPLIGILAAAALLYGVRYYGDDLKRIGITVIQHKHEALG